MISRVKSTQFSMVEDQAMGGLSHPSIDDDKSHRRKSDFDQQKAQPTLIDIELNSMLTYADCVYC